MKLENNLKVFLQETEFCDFTHSGIQNKMQEIAGNINDDTEASIALFEYVRDNIRYSLGYWGKKASIVLQEQSGMCTNSANLLVALLRARGIPSGYGVMRVNAQEYFGPIMPNIFKKMVSDRSVHIYSYAYLNDNWLKCDPSTDKELSDKTSYFNSTTELVIWDGKSDKIDNINPDHIYSESNPLPNIDDMLKRKARHAKGIPLRVGNLYIKFLRQNEKRIENIDELETLFLKWLKVNYPLYYISILSISKIIK